MNAKMKSTNVFQRQITEFAQTCWVLTLVLAREVFMETEFCQAAQLVTKQELVVMVGIF